MIYCQSSTFPINPVALIAQASANRGLAAGCKVLINNDLCNRLENVDPPYEKFLWDLPWSIPDHQITN